MLKDKTLAIFSLRTFLKTRDGYLSSSPMGEYLEKYCSYFKEVLLYAPVVNKDIFGKYDFKFSKPNLTFRCIQQCPVSGPHKIAKYAKFTFFIIRDIRRWDVGLIFFPGFLGLLAFVLSKVFSKKTVLYIAGDWGESIRAESLQTKKVPALLKELLANFYFIISKFVVKCSHVTLVAGMALYERYWAEGKLIARRFPIMKITPENFYYRQDSCLEKEIALLYVGPIIARKGIRYLLEAVSALRKERIAVNLELVGQGVDNDYFKKYVQDLEISKYCRFVNYISNGEKLFNVYRKSDVFILPTLTEGEPRVLYEAMSQGLPIICTAIGGIPGLVKNQENGLLLPPRSAISISTAIKRIISGKALRMKIIANNYKVVSEACDKDPVLQVVELIQKHL